LCTTRRDDSAKDLLAKHIGRRPNVLDSDAISEYYAGLGSPADLQIPPNTVTEHQGSMVLQEPTILHNFQPHMHYRGKVQTLEAIYPDGRREVINQISRFTNNWHINYIYDPDSAPVFPKGTVLIVTSIHDNTAGNKSNPGPRQWVTWGERTVDEMAHLNEQLIYITERTTSGLSKNARREPRHRIDQRFHITRDL
jgi:hypothetical protein